LLSVEKTNLIEKLNTLEKKMGGQEEEMAHKEAELAELSKTINTMKDDATQSYIFGFEAVM